MQIFALLKEDHAEVKGLLKKMTESGGAKTRQRFFQKLKPALLAHAHAEEKTFYHALLQHDQTADLALEAAVEHQIVERLLEDMSNGALRPDQFSARCKVLRELFEHHVKEEEGHIFKAARKVLAKNQLHELSTQFEAVKERQVQGID